MFVHRNTWEWGTTNTIIHRDGVGIVSISFYNEESDVAWIHNLSVVNGYRRRGIGDELLHLAEQEAKSLGAKEIKLCCYGGFVKEWYERKGYEFLERIDNEIVLIKKLS